MMEQPPPELDIHAIRRVRERIGAQILQDALEHAEHDEADASTMSVEWPLWTSTLSTIDLEKERRDEGEDLHEKRGDEDIVSGLR